MMCALITEQGVLRLVCGVLQPLPDGVKKVFSPANKKQNYKIDSQNKSLPF